MAWIFVEWVFTKFVFIWLSDYLETNGFLQSLCLFDYQDYIETLKQNILQLNLHMNGHLIVIYSVCVFFAQKSTKCVVSERVIVVECQVSKFTVIIWPDQVGFWWMDFIVLTHWKNSQSIDRHVALIGNLIPSLSQSVFLSYSFILSSNKSQFYRFDTSGDLTYDLLVYATGSEQANHYTTEAVKEKF